MPLYKDRRTVPPQVSLPANCPKMMPHGIRKRLLLLLVQQLMSKTATCTIALVACCCGSALVPAAAAALLYCTAGAGQHNPHAARRTHSAGCCFVAQQPPHAIPVAAGQSPTLHVSSVAKGGINQQCCQELLALLALMPCCSANCVANSNGTAAKAGAMHHIRPKLMPSCNNKCCCRCLAV